MQLSTALTNILLAGTQVFALPVHSSHPARSVKASPVGALEFFRHFDIVIHEFPPMPASKHHEGESPWASSTPGRQQAVAAAQAVAGVTVATEAQPLMITFMAKSKNSPVCPSKAEILMYLIRAYGNIWELLGRPIDWRMAKWVMSLIDLPNFACKNL